MPIFVGSARMVFSVRSLEASSRQLPNVIVIAESRARRLRRLNKDSGACSLGGESMSLLSLVLEP